MMINTEVNSNGLYRGTTNSNSPTEESDMNAMTHPDTVKSDHSKVEYSGVFNLPAKLTQPRIPKNDKSQTNVVGYRVDTEAYTPDIIRGDLIAIDRDQPGWQDDGYYYLFYSDGGEEQCLGFDYVQTMTKKGQLRKSVAINNIRCSTDPTKYENFRPYRVIGVSRTAEIRKHSMTEVDWIGNREKSLPEIVGIVTAAINEGKEVELSITVYGLTWIWIVADGRPYEEAFPLTEDELQEILPMYQKYKYGEEADGQDI